MSAAEELRRPALNGEGAAGVPPPAPPRRSGVVAVVCARIVASSCCSCASTALLPPPRACVSLGSGLRRSCRWHALAAETIILPVLARDEEPQPTTQESMFNYVRLSDGGSRRHDGPRSEVEVIAEIASRVLGEDSPVDWTSMKDTCSIRKAIGKVVPGFEAIGRIDETRQEFQIDGRTFHRPRFATESGRAQLHSQRLPELKGAGDELRLMTVRSEGQFNTVVYEEEDYYRGQDRRDVILVHPGDLASLGLEHDQLVSVQSETGQLDKIRVRAFAAIRQGNALMYFPEANVLVNRQVDAQSRTPAFKGVVVRIRAAVPGPSEMETSVD